MEVCHKSFCNDLDIDYLKKCNLVFQKILDISKDGFLVVDEESRIIDINKAYCEFLGLKKEDIIGKHVLEIIKNSKLPNILETGDVDIDVVHKLVRGQCPSQEKYAIVTRAPVKEGKKVIAAFGQVKFSLNTMELASKLQDLDMELQYYKNELKRIIGNRYTFENMVGNCIEFNKAKTIGQKAASNDFSVLLTGETGTGKEVFANAIHYASKRRNKPFIRINCAAIPSELLESELFGYTEGSFTGAKRGGKKGKFEIANGGTIFLDEIGEMPLSMQAKLLRVLQEKEIEKIGAYNPIPIDVRIIAATNKNLKDKIKDKAFREDLYYRLNVIEIKIPPLRKRKDDIKLLIDYFINDLNEKYNTDISISSEAIKTLINYKWPGNVRELKNVIERIFALTDETTITNKNLPAYILTQSKIHTPASYNNTLDKIMENIEREIILEMLSKNNNNCSKTAKELGIHRSTLYKKMEKLNIQSNKDF